MKRQATRVLCTLAALAAVGACDAADVHVFAAGPADAAGMAGATGDSAGAGSAGMGGAISGGAGISGAGTGGGGAPAGLGGDFSAGGGDTVCHRNADCPGETLFCLTESCEPGAPGVCTLRPPICDSTLQFVCGCDHLTYWNPCLLYQHGFSKSADGTCEVGAKLCRGNNDCPPMSGSTCARLQTSDVGCGTSADQGACWVTPSDCSMTGDTLQWQSCPPPGSGSGLGPCTSTCMAAKVGRPFIQVDSATCP
ncbi:MAG: hypothetical protein ABI548_18425 [Polyangiaceae bacterium]